MIPWTAVHQASLSFTISWSLLKLAQYCLILAHFYSEGVTLYGPYPREEVVYQPCLFGGSQSLTVPQSNKANSTTARPLLLWRSSEYPRAAAILSAAHTSLLFWSFPALSSVIAHNVNFLMFLRLFLFYLYF